MIGFFSRGNDANWDYSICSRNKKPWAMPSQWLWNEPPLGNLWIQVPNMLGAWVGSENASPKGDPVGTAWHNIAIGINSLCKPPSFREQPATVSLGLNEMPRLLLGNWKWNVTDRKYEMWDFFPARIHFCREIFSQQECKSLLEKKKIANNYFF